MPVFISMLRGINVAGQRKVPMAQLQALYESLGFRKVTTYIQSGNVVFEWSSAKGLAAKIGEAIQKEFGFEVPVIIRTKAEWKAAFEGNPFLSKKEVDHSKLHITFLGAAPDEALSSKLRALDFMPDRFHISGSEIYLYVPGSYGETKLSNAFIESKLKVKATTRNWKTVTKLMEMAGS